MHLFLFKIIVLGNALLLTLPSGWCCAFAQHQRMPAESDCCHTSVPVQHDDSSHYPATPQIDCCCSLDAAIVVQSAELQDTASLALSVTLGLGDSDHRLQQGLESAVPLLDTGPRLHALQCVWQC